MAFASVGTLGTFQALSSTNTIPLVISAAAEAGNLVVVKFAFDNLGSGTDNVDASEVTGVTDSATGNTWVKGGETSNNNGAAGAGVTISVWYSVITNQINSSGTITATLSGNATARTAAAWEFTKGAGTTISRQALTTDVGDTADPANVSLASLPSKEYLLIYGFGGEQSNAGAYTAATNYTAMGKTGTGGGGTTDIMVTGDFRIATLTSDSHDAATATDRDYAAVYFALYEVAGGTNYPQTVAGTVTPTGAVSRTTAKSVAGSSTPTGALLRSVAKFATGTLTSTGALARQTAKNLAGTLTSSGALTSTITFLVSVSGTLSSAGTLSRNTAKSLVGALASVGTLGREVAKNLTGTVASAGALARATAKSLAGTLTSSGTLARGIAFLVSVGGTLSSAGSLFKRTEKPVAGSVTPTGGISKAISKFFAGVLSFVGTLTSTGGTTPEIVPLVTWDLWERNLTSENIWHVQPRTLDWNLEARSFDLSLETRNLTGENTWNIQPRSLDWVVVIRE